MFDKREIAQRLSQGLSLAEICKMHGWSYSRVYYWCKQNNIKISRSSNGKSSATLNARQMQRVFTNDDKDTLFTLYVTDGLSAAQIAKRFNTTAATVTATLRSFNIPVKLKNGKYSKVTPTTPKHILEQLYITQHLSAQEIADLLGYKHHGQVIEEMKFYSIPRRTYQEAGALLYQKRPEKRNLHREQFYAGVTGPKQATITSLEKKFMDWATNNGIKFTYQFQIRSNWHRYDFLLNGTNVIVEMDGDFWHSSPEHLERDQKFDETARRYGYIVVRIRESQVQSNNNIFNELLLPMILQEQTNANT